MGTDILETIKSELPKGTISSMNFEGANIVIYTEDGKFLKEGDEVIKGIVNKIKTERGRHQGLERIR
jgi:predicted metal-dependent RNase